MGIILTEILQGIRNPKEYKQVHDLLGSLFYLESKKEIFVLAAEIYRSLRLGGITIRKTIDCMIAASSMHYQVLLLHNDRDFDPIEKYFDLRVKKVKSSLGSAKGLVSISKDFNMKTSLDTHVGMY